MENLSNRYVKIANKVSKIVGFVTGAWFFILLIVLAYQVVSRSILNSSASWTEELASYSLVWIVMLGIAIGVHELTIPKIDIFTMKLPEKWQYILEIICHLLTCILFVVLIVYGFKMCKKVFPQNISSLHISVTYCYLSIPVGAILDFFFAFEHISKCIVKIQKLSAGTAVK